MKKIILLVLVFSVNISFSQQCKLSLDQLFKVIDYDHSDFDTFALKNGFSYNTTMQSYLCDKNNDAQNLLSKGEESGFTILTYSFYKKKEYLRFKEIIEQGVLIETINRKELLAFHYIYDGKTILHGTSTYIDGSNTYVIAINKETEAQH